MAEKTFNEYGKTQAIDLLRQFAGRRDQGIGALWFSRRRHVDSASPSDRKGFFIHHTINTPGTATATENR